MRRIIAATVCMALFFANSLAQTINITYDEDNEVKVGGDIIEDVRIKIKGNNVNIKDLRDSDQQLNTITYVLKGKSSDGSFKLNTYVKAKVVFDGLDLTSQEGAPIHLKNYELVEIECSQGTENTIRIMACNDTLNNKQSVIWSKDAIKIKGKGKLNLLALGNGCKGINAKNNIDIQDLALNVVTKGDNLGIDTTRTMGPMGMRPDSMMMHGPMGMMPDSMMMHGPMGMRPDSMMMHGPLGMRPDSMMMHGEHMGMAFGGGMPGGKQKYLSTCKGIKSKGVITIHSGTVMVETNSQGAEGIEGKQGVTINGGTISVNSTDDGINSGGRIIFSGGNTTVISKDNDAVDSNHNSGGESAILVSGGTVKAWSMKGAPEEGMDSDFSPIEICGGQLFTIGAGMGDMPSVPTQQTAKQATALVIGLKFTEGENVNIKDHKGKTLMEFTIPFSFQRSSSLISIPEFVKGNTYTIACGGQTKSIKLTEQLTIIR